MMKIKKFFLINLIFALLITTSGCSEVFDFSGNKDQKNSDTKKNQEAQEENQEPPVSESTYNQNDYAGACYRIGAIRKKMKSITEVLNTYTKSIIDSDPGDYWNNDAFISVDFDPVSDKEFQKTVKLNEKDTEDALGAYYTNLITEMGGSGVTFIKRKNNDYFLRYSKKFINESLWKDFSGTGEEVCKYDPTNGALQYQLVAYDGNKRLITTHFYEFVPIGDNCFLLQDNNERLWVEFDGENLYQYVYTKLNENDRYKIPSMIPTKLSDKTVAEVNESNISEGEIATINIDNVASIYSDSIFDNKDNFGPDWPLEKDNFETKIIYDGKSFDITSYNEFNNKYNNVYIELDEDNNISNVDSNEYEAMFNDQTNDSEELPDANQLDENAQTEDYNEQNYDEPAENAANN